MREPRRRARLGDARTRLGHYVPDAEAEALVDSIPYWDYAGTKP